MAMVPKSQLAAHDAARRRFLATTAAACALPLVGSELADARAAAEEQFPELVDERGALEGIRPEERAARRKRLGEILAKNQLDAYLCEDGPTLHYLAGINWGLSERIFALVVLADGSHFFLSPAFEAEKARLRIEGKDGPGGEIVAWNEDEYAWKPLAAALKKRGAERVAVDPYLRFFAANNLAREIGAANVVSGQNVRTELRGVKDRREIELLRRACELTQKALGATAKRVKIGMTGAEISLLIDTALKKTGLTSTWNLSLVGPAAAYPHGGSSSARLEKGQFLLIDCGGEYHEYQSDNTRTWCVEGPPDPEALKAWHAVYDAQRRAFDVAAAGKVCGDIDRAAREAIERAGFQSDYKNFTHRLGHGIGMEGHEDPYFDKGSKVVLEPGMTLSNEPGLYFLGRFGIRLEDILLVTKNGSECFGAPQNVPDRPVG